MKILFAVMGAEKLIENGMHDLIRNTWAKHTPEYGDFRFFVGRGESVLTPDTIRVDTPDDKDNLIYKVVEMCRWALQNDYQMLKTDIDTYVNVPLMMQQNLAFDYSGAPVGKLGDMYGNTGAWSWVQGSAMWLSKLAMQIIVTDAIPRMNDARATLMKDNGIISPYPHSEDLWIGQALRDRVHAVADSRYSNGPLTYHFAICHSTCTQDEWDRRLREWFKQLHEGNFAYHESR
jgi:hypothetical protein